VEDEVYDTIDSDDNEEEAEFTNNAREDDKPAIDKDALH
jgi:hypothetical protein